METPKYTKKVDVGNFVVDNSKLRDLGWSPKVSVKEGILKTLDYFKVQNLWKVTLFYFYPKNFGMKWIQNHEECYPF